MPTSVISLRVSEEQAARLKRKARQLGKTASETGAMLIEESLRRDAFAFIDFRDSSVGRQAYVMGSRATVWQVVSVARSFDGDEAATAAHLGWPVVKVRAASRYAAAFPSEIEDAIRDNQAQDADSLGRLLPELEAFVAPARRR